MERIDTEGLTIEELLAKASDHEREFPTHGIDCACLDPLIQAVRRLTTVEGAGSYPDDNKWSEWTAPGAPFRQQQRVDYVMRRALDHRR